MKHEPYRKVKMPAYKLQVPEHHHVMLSLLHVDYAHCSQPELQATIAIRQGGKLTLPVFSSWLTQVFDTGLVAIRYHVTPMMNKGFRMVYSFHLVRKGER